MHAERIIDCRTFTLRYIPGYVFVLCNDWCVVWGIWSMEEEVNFELYIHFNRSNNFFFHWTFNARLPFYLSLHLSFELATAKLNEKFKHHVTRLICWQSLFIILQKHDEVARFKIKQREMRNDLAHKTLILVLERESFAVYHVFSSPENKDAVQTLSLSLSPSCLY